jgi:hypothetical protein
VEPVRDAPAPSAGARGTFPSESGPNCFTTVLEASGEVEAAKRWGVREPFDEWLADRTRPDGEDERPGTVFVWRNRDGFSEHAALTIGDGWALEKPSQDWHAPRVVRSVRELIDANRVHGRLERRELRTDRRGAPPAPRPS